MLYSLNTFLLRSVTCGHWKIESIAASILGYELELDQVTGRIILSLCSTPVQRSLCWIMCGNTLTFGLATRWTRKRAFFLSWRLMTCSLGVSNRGNRFCANRNSGWSEIQRILYNIRTLFQPFGLSLAVFSELIV